MADDTDKVVSITSGPVHWNHQHRVQLFAPEDVVNGLPVERFDELVVCARTHDGKVFIAGTHSVAVMSLLLANAQHWMGSQYEMEEG